jgi:hypothetical protein
MVYDIDDLKERRICHDCVREPYLQAEIRSKGKLEQCFYCEESAETYTLNELSEPITKAFEDHYIQLTDDPDDVGAPVVDTIEDAVQIPREAAENLQQVLSDVNYDHRAAKQGEDSPFSDGSFYDQKGIDDWDWKYEWTFFENSLKSEARFFSRSAMARLATVFGGIDKMVTHDGRTIVLGAGPGAQFTHVYRARVFQSDGDLEKALCRPDERKRPQIPS